MMRDIETWWIAGGFGLLLAAAGVCVALIVLLRPYLKRYALARPNARSSHTIPTPQGGGIAIVIATIVLTAIIVIAAGPSSPETAERLWPVFAATAFIALVGAIDDIRTIAIAPRLLLQTISVAVVIATLPAELQVLPMLPWWVERALLLLAGVWFVNLVNFMDGIDWMTVAEVVPLIGGVILIGLFSSALPAPAMVVALALGGAMLGFAPFNRPVARLFLGDVGSLPIGLLLLWLLVLTAGSGYLAAALILPLYYLADATLTLLQRLLNGEPFWQAHRSHFYQRAVDRGYSVSQVIARVFALNLTLIVLALFTIFVPGIASAIAALAVSALLVGWLLLTFARGKPRGKA
jgi:UDP-N-acetylmuramyl pentapeptide phosphotransferase/UDP-N-acetylglucosamine-1-phosphate transferase